MNYDRTERIRRAAILVASLDDALAEQLLASLPPAEAAKVLDEVDRLDAIDPEEHADVLAEFRRGARGSAAADQAVEFTYTAAQTAAGSHEPRIDSPAAEPSPASTPLMDADADLLVELLAEEHPQTIAAALTRLSHDQGAAVFAAMPPHLQGEVLDRVTNLQSADEEAVLEVESQLLRRIEQRQERRQRAALGADMARRMIAKTSPADQTALLERLSRSEAVRYDARQSSMTAASAAGRAPADQSATMALHDEAPLAQQARNLATAVRMARERSSDRHGDSPHPLDAGAHDEAPVHPHPQPRQALEVLEDRSQELENLSDQMLLVALQRADQQTIQWALAASSEQFVQRVARKLPRRQAQRLRTSLRSLGPTRLADLRCAQHELLRVAFGRRDALPVFPAEILADRLTQSA